MLNTHSIPFYTPVCPPATMKNCIYRNICLNMCCFHDGYFLWVFLVSNNMEQLRFIAFPLYLLLFFYYNVVHGLWHQVHSLTFSIHRFWSNKTSCRRCFWF